MENQPLRELPEAFWVGMSCTGLAAPGKLGELQSQLPQELLNSAWTGEPQCQDGMEGPDPLIPMEEQSQHLCWDKLLWEDLPRRGRIAVSQCPQS